MSTYRTGTATATAGSATVTFAGGANLITAGIREGDQIEIGGVVAEIAAVNSTTSASLRRPWPGATQTAQPYGIWLIDDGQRSVSAVNNLIGMVGAGSVASLGGLPAVANEMPYWTGPGVMARTALTPAARAMLGLAGAAGARVPVFTGTGTAALREIVGTVSQSGGVPTGAIIQSGSNANGRFVRYADGTQICWIEQLAATASSTGVLQATWEYPAAFAGGNSTRAGLVSVRSVPPFAQSVGILVGTFGATSATGVGLRGNSGSYITDETTATFGVVCHGRWF